MVTTRNQIIRVRILVNRIPARKATIKWPQEITEIKNLILSIWKR